MAAHFNVFYTIIETEACLTWGKVIKMQELCPMHSEQTMTMAALANIQRDSSTVLAADMQAMYMTINNKLKESAGKS